VNKKITKEDVKKALDTLGTGLDDGDGEEPTVKASENDLDQPEGTDFQGKHTNLKGKKKMSDDAPGPDKSPTKKSDGGDEMDLNKAKELLEAEGFTVAKSEGEDGGTPFREQLPEEVQTKVDVSDFLRSLVDTTADSIDSMQATVRKSIEGNEENVDHLVEQVAEIQKSQGKIGVVLKAICERIGVIENAPAAPVKTDLVNKSGQPQQFADRQFEQGGQPTQPQGAEPIFKGLSQNPVIVKSQISSALCDLVKKGEATDMDVIGFESGHHIRPELVTKLQQGMN
jgi:hypothetical protein